MNEYNIGDIRYDQQTQQYLVKSPFGLDSWDICTDPEVDLYNGLTHNLKEEFDITPEQLIEMMKIHYPEKLI